MHLNSSAAFGNLTFEFNPDLGVDVRSKMSECLSLTHQTKCHLLKQGHFSIKAFHKINEFS